MTRGMRHGAGGIVALAVAGLATSASLAPGDLAAQTMDDHIYTYVAFDEIEYVPDVQGRPVGYDAQAWVGGDLNKLWLKTYGEQSTLGSEGHFEGQALYSRAVSAFWNAQAGLRVDHSYGGDHEVTRGLAAVGVGGLAPYWFEVEAFLFVSHEADVSARLEASYDILFTQRLVLEPEIELNAAVQEVPELGIGSGLNDVELAARLRYEIVRELAPYVGFSWLRRTGATADLARAAGGPVGDGSFVAGVRWWY